MRKILPLLYLSSFFIYLLIPLLGINSEVKAASCTFTTEAIYPPNSPHTDKNPNQNMEKLKVTIETNQLPASGNNYRLELSPRDRTPIIQDVTLRPQANNVNRVEAIFDKPVRTGWTTGRYELKLYAYKTNFISLQGIFKEERVSGLDCTSSVNVNASVSQSCSLQLIHSGSTVDPNTILTIRPANIANGDYQIKVTGNNVDKSYDLHIGRTSRGDVNIDQLSPGQYTVKIFNACGGGGLACLFGAQQQEQCPPIGIQVVNIGQPGGGQVPVGPGPGGGGGTGGALCSTPNPNPSPGATPDPNACATGAGDTGCLSDPAVRYVGVRTAIGCIPTEPQEFINRTMRVFAYAGGGIALLMMIFGAFEMMTSQGDPNKLKGGRERMIAAGSGLLFILFSTVILQIIGVDILGLPGFTR